MNGFTIRSYVRDLWNKLFFMFFMWTKKSNNKNKKKIRRIFVKTNPRLMRVSELNVYEFLPSCHPFGN